jgi:hypothetical protein
MCPILDGYGVMTVFLIPVHDLVWTLHNQLAGHVLSLVAYFCQLQTAQFLLFRHLEPARFTTERQPVFRPAVAFSKTSFKHR